MAMNKTELQNTLDTFFAGDRTREQAAAELATIIDAYIRTASVNVTLVNVSGTIVGTSPAGAVSGTCTATGTGSGELL